MKPPLALLAIVWVCALLIVAAIARADLLGGTSNSKMYANPLTGQIYGVGPIITPTATPAPTQSPTATPTP